MGSRLSWLSLLPLLVFVVVARGQPVPGRFPFPAPQPCAGPNVVPAAVQALADRVVAVTRALDANEPGVWRVLRELAEAACLAGDQATLAAAYERCTSGCRDPGERYLPHLDYAAALERFGDVVAAERQYQAAIALRPGRPPEAIEAYNRYALLLEQQARPSLGAHAPPVRGAWRITASSATSMPTVDSSSCCSVGTKVAERLRCSRRRTATSGGAPRCSRSASPRCVPRRTRCTPIG